MRVAGPTYGAALLCLLHTVAGSYVITSPRKWTAGSQTQICLTVTPLDEVRVTVFTVEPPEPNPISFYGDDKPEEPWVPVKDGVLIPEKVLKVHRGSPTTCHHLTVPFTRKKHGLLEVNGNLGGSFIQESKNIVFATDVIQTYIQTDKYLYKAGQKVQFRVLTIQGPFMKVSTESYPELTVETPSGSRIEQWLNVSNPSGLIHRDLQLLDEPEQGVYKIKAQVPGSGEMVTKEFEVEEFVLPRFEVTINTPPYLLADAKLLKIEVCATYTFGQAVRGNVSLVFYKVIDSYRFWSSYLETTAVLTMDEQLFGCKSFEVYLNEFGPDEASRVEIEATMKEAGTSNEAEAKVSMEITRTVLTMNSPVKTNYLKPELPYVTSMKATYPDGRRAAHEPMKVCVQEICRNFTTDDQGNLKFAVPPHLRVHDAKVTALNYPAKKTVRPNSEYARTYMYESTFTAHVKLYHSPSHSSLYISREVSQLQCNTGQNSTELTLSVMFAANNLTETLLHVQVVSRGQIQFWNSVKVSLSASPLLVDDSIFVAPMQPPSSRSTVRGTLKVPVQLLPTASPTVWVLMWYSRPDGEVVSDAQELKVAKCLENNVSLTWRTNSAEQGSVVPLTLTAEPSSLCSLGVVDKSVELLGASKDSLTLDKVFEIVEKASVGSENSQISDSEYCKTKTYPGDEFIVPLDGPGPLRPISISGSYYVYNTFPVDALKMFDESGLNIISDLTYETRPCERNIGFPSEPVVYSEPFGGGGGGGGGGGEEEDPSGDGGARTYFPETWLWDLTTIPDTGSSVQDLRLPNTVTEWVGRAVCVHPSKGLGISTASRVTAFTSFFIDLTVPPTVKKGEVMPILISVFNYLDDSLPVTITLEPSPEYEILGLEGPEAAPVQEDGGLRTACIPQGDKETVTVRVRPLAVGAVNVTVSAVVDNASNTGQCSSGANITKVDRIISPITVEFEGFSHEQSWSKYMCSEDLSNNLDHFEDWRLEAPTDIVPESARAWVTVVGDLLGPTLDNLGNLIKLPTGCGEQNMLNFAPNIFVLQYLEASDQTTGPVADKIMSFMKTGYKRELTYKHHDGSYSAFGKSDKSGSTWLTAFVVKSFAQARQYIQIDPKELEASTTWLKERQLQNGCFESVGTLLHKDMQGGLAEGGSPSVLSAFVTLALLESGEDPKSEAMTKAVTCLQATDKASYGPYYAALKAYALSLAALPETDRAISDLLKMAVDASSGLYWDFSPPGNSTPKPDSTVPPVAVETAGYALLAMVSRGPEFYKTHTHRIVKWISKQRNSQGGFVSTQDTVVALQGLAAYESYQSSEPLDLIVTVTGDSVAQQFTVVESNKLLNQRLELPTIPTSLMVDMTGTGCTLVQAVVRYNIFDPEPSEAFSVVASAEPALTTCQAFIIQTCTRYELSDSQSNMAVIEVGLVSGYIPDKADLKRIISRGTENVKRYEVDGNKVLFYIDQITADLTCLSFEVLREAVVENAKPATVRVYDYYEPELVVSTTYVHPQGQPCEGDALAE